MWGLYVSIQLVSLASREFLNGEVIGSRFLLVSIQLVSLASRESDDDERVPRLIKEYVSIQLVSLASREFKDGQDQAATDFKVSIQLVSLASREYKKAAYCEYYQLWFPFNWFP